MTRQQFIEAIRGFCSAHANAENRVKYSRYFKEGLYDGYGLTAPQMYAKTRELLSLPDVTLSLVLDAAGDIIRFGKSEEISIMMLIAGGRHKQFTKDTFVRIETWFTLGVNNWAHADTMAMRILPHFLSRNMIAISDFSDWLRASNKFQRRCVPVTLIKSLKTADHYTELFAFIECLMTDSEREVHQGVGWFLREAWKRKPEETEAFLFKWKDNAPRLIFQYATEKMTADGKKRFRREQRR